LDFAVAPKPEVTPALLERGKRLYAQNCTACHGINGDGKGDALRSWHRSRAIS
jgi:mono/diheme cytochrome c family protein